MWGGMTMRAIKVYESLDGRIPMREFLASLDNKLRRKLLMQFVRLSQVPLCELKEPHFKHFVLEKYSQEKDGMEKTELAAMMLLKMAEDTENLVPKARLRQEGLYLLKYVQEHGNTYSLPRNLLIQFLESKN